MKPLLFAVLITACCNASSTGNVSLTLKRVERDCSRGDAGVTKSSIQVQYRFLGSGDSGRASDWMLLFEINSTEGFNGNMTLPSSSSPSLSFVQFRLLQMEHGGGTCNCWRVENAVVMSHRGSTNLINERIICSSMLNETGSLTFCGGLAREVRGLIFEEVQIQSSGGGNQNCRANSSTLIRNLESSLMRQDCTYTRKLEISYGLSVAPSSNISSCDGPESISEAIEFAMRVNISGVYGSWIPLRLTQNGRANTTSTNIRGYDVEVNQVSESEHVTICGDDLLSDNVSGVQFRWMNTVDGEGIDFWTLFDVTINLTSSDNSSGRIFDSRSQNSRWLEIRNGGINCSVCPDIGSCDLAFGSDQLNTTSLVSNIALTRQLSLQNGSFLVESQPIPSPTATALCTFCSSSDQSLNVSPSTTTSILVSSKQLFNNNSLSTSSYETLTSIALETHSYTLQPSYSSTVEMPQTFAQTLAMNSSSSIMSQQLTSTLIPVALTRTASDLRSYNLQPSLSSTSKVPQVVYPSTDTLMISRFATSTSGLPTATPITLQPSPSTTSPTTTSSENSIFDTVMSADPVKGSQLLRNISEELKPADTLYLLKDILDRFNSTEREEKNKLAENFLEIGEKLIIAGREKENMDTIKDTVGSSLLSVIDRLALEVFSSEGNISTQNIALQILMVSVDNESITTINSNDYFDDLPLMSIEIPSELVELFEKGSVQTISALYYNVTDLFPDGPLLGSGVVSTGLQCGDSLCNTTEIKLTKPVVITIEHKTKLKIASTQKTETKCVFWDFSEESTNGSSLTTGNWSDRGCLRNATLSNDSYTVCECDHLTHFAILLSPVPLDAFSPEVQISLQVIGYVGVTISLVAMAVTIMTFILFKSLHTMRNYIHIHLCINLMIAQLIFVVGIDKSAEDHVPVHCQAIAVLLHYFFLVSFMWMLMEGAVLYVVLVLVFAKHKKFYILGFTIASYGIPLLYMGLTLPLGFALDGEHYGRRSACFLNPETHFIWAFIAPVIVVIVMNFVLFLIVAKVMWKHQKRMTDKAKLVNVRRWLRSAMFLVVIMGLTWIIGVLVLEVEALLPLAYIFTIMVAFQGLAIFLIFVPFSKQVRDTFRKWWKVKVNDSTILTRYFGSDTLSYGSNLKSSQKNSTLPSRNDEKKDASFLMDSIVKDVSFEKNGKHFEDSSIVISNRFSTSIDPASN